MVRLLSVLVAFTLAVASSSMLLGQATPAPVGVSVRLEAHEGRANFFIGEPIVVDLVFAGRTPEYSVNTSQYLYLPVPEVVEVQPADGWSRSHGAVPEGLSETPAKLEGAPVRVPILLNRTITFERPGRYAVVVSTDRLVRSDLSGDTEATTNALVLELRARSEAEESALVKKLYDQLASAPKIVKAPDLPNPETLTLEQMNQLMTEMDEEEQRATRDRQEAAWELAFLPGDDAVRAKVVLIAAYTETGNGDGMALQLVSGLPSSRDIKLQADLLNQAWHDPKHVPTEVLETALRQGRELLAGPMVIDSQMSARALSDPAVMAREQAKSEKIRADEMAELQELVGTLGQRSETNREKTVCFMKLRGVAADGSLRKPAKCDAP